MQGLHLTTGLPAARWLNKPIIMKFSGSGVIPHMKNSLAGRLEVKWLARWARRIMVLNDDMVEEAVEAGLPRRSLLWMPNPVNTCQFQPLSRDAISEWRERHGLPQEATLVIYTGRLSQEKGLTQLLRGFAQASPGAPGMMLLLVGDGAQRAELEALARQLNLGPGQVRFTGRVEPRQIPIWLGSSDVFALLSPSEGFSCALLEGMSSGLASVVTAIPANGQLIEDHVHGLMVPFDDDAAAAQAFLDLFRRVEMRRSMGSAARDRVLENFSTGRVVERYEILLAEVLGL